jgi:hypothetical protein
MTVYVAFLPLILYIQKINGKLNILTTYTVNDELSDSWILGSTINYAQTIEIKHGFTAAVI